MRNQEVFVSHDGAKDLFAVDPMKLNSYGIDEIYPIHRRSIKQSKLAALDIDFQQCHSFRRGHCEDRRDIERLDLRNLASFNLTAGLRPFLTIKSASIREDKVSVLIPDSSLQKCYPLAEAGSIPNQHFEVIEIGFKRDDMCVGKAPQKVER